MYETEFIDYTNIIKSEIDGYFVHVYEWDEDKHIIAVHLRNKSETNVAVKTFTEDLKSTLSLMTDRILTGFSKFDKNVLVYGIPGEINRILDYHIQDLILKEKKLRMEINPYVIVIRRKGPAASNRGLNRDINFAIEVAKRVDIITSPPSEFAFETE